MKKQWVFVGDFQQLKDFGFTECNLVWKRQTGFMLDSEWDDVCVVKPTNPYAESKLVLWNNPRNTEHIEDYIEDLIEKGLVK